MTLNVVAMLAVQNAPWRQRLRLVRLCALSDEGNHTAMGLTPRAPEAAGGGGDVGGAGFGAGSVPDRCAPRNFARRTVDNWLRMTAGERTLPSSKTAGLRATIGAGGGGATAALAADPWRFSGGSGDADATSGAAAATGGGWLCRCNSFPSAARQAPRSPLPPTAPIRSSAYKHAQLNGTDTFAIDRPTGFSLCACRATSTVNKCP